MVSEPSFNTKRPIGTPRYHRKEKTYNIKFWFLTENFPVIKTLFCSYRNFYSTVQFMNTKEEKSHQGNMSTPTPEVNLVVELNSDVLKTLHNLQDELKSFKEDSLNERKEHQAINEALLRFMVGGIPQGKPTQSTNRSKRELYHEWASNPREAERKCIPEATKGDHHSPASDDSLYPWRKRQRSDDNL